MAIVWIGLGLNLGATGSEPPADQRRQFEPPTLGWFKV
jgi:hypothetical protein